MVITEITMETLYLNIVLLMENKNYSWNYFGKSSYMTSTVPIEDSSVGFITEVLSVYHHNNCIAS